jgi:hypothetical protein
MTPPTGGLADLYRRSLASGISERLPGGRGANKVPTDSSSNGEYLLYTSTVDLVGDLHALPLSGGTPIRIAEQAAVGIGRFSADGRWVAYQRTNAVTKGNEVCIQPFPSTSSSLPQISFSGRSPEWSRDGKELYYVSPDNRLMAVRVKLPADDRESIEFGVPAALFTLPEGSSYIPAPDGQRFLLNVPAEGAPPIYILSNWTRSTGIDPALERRP